MADKHYPTPMLDVLEEGQWPSFISGIKDLRDNHPDKRIRGVTNSLLGQLEHSYETRMGYWKGGTISVFGYGGGIIPRFSEVGHMFPESKEPVIKPLLNVVSANTWSNNGESLSLTVISAWASS